MHQLKARSKSTSTKSTTKSKTLTSLAKRSQRAIQTTKRLKNKNFNHGLNPTASSAPSSVSSENQPTVINDAFGSVHFESVFETGSSQTLSQETHSMPQQSITLSPQFQHSSQSETVSTSRSAHQAGRALTTDLQLDGHNRTKLRTQSPHHVAGLGHSTPSEQTPPFHQHYQSIHIMEHSPLHRTQARSFQTRYNTVQTGGDPNQPLTQYNTAPSPSSPAQGVYTSSHFQLTRETLVAYLTRKNLTFKHSGDKTIIMECPLCPKPTYGKPDNLWKLCIFDNGAFVCLRCQSKGSWYDFKSKLGDLPNITNSAGRPIYQHHQSISQIDDSGDSQMEYLREQQEEYKQLSQTECEQMVHNLDQSPAILTWFENVRKIRRETLLKYKVGSTKVKFPQVNPATKRVEWVEDECMTFPWADRQSATDDHNLTYSRVKARSVTDKKNMRLMPKGGSWGFFGWHTVPLQSKSIIITEGELDAMSIFQATGIPAISLPNGANSLPPALLPSLERFEKITLWLDDDQAGHAAVESMSQKLGVGRTYHIPGGYGAKDANEALQKGLNIGSILDTATRQQHKQISTFGSFRHEVKRMFFDPNTQVGVQYPNMPILQSLIKGHRRGELSILTGGTGVGKTTLLTQLSLELASQGVNTLWGSFEIRNPRLVKTLMKQHAAVLGVVLNEQHPEAFDYVADKFEELPFNFLKFYGSSPVQEVIEAMEYATYVHDTQHIILDNLQFMLSGQGRGGGDKFELQDRAIEAFRQFASQRNVHVTLVIHPRKEQDNSSLGIASVFGSAKATQEADNVMIIQGGLPRTVLRNIQLPETEGNKQKSSTQLKQNTGGDLGQHGGFEDPIIGEIMGTFFRTIELRKNRWDGDLGSVPLRFDKSSSRFYELTSDDISLGLGEFISKQKKLKQLDIIKHMNQLPGTAGMAAPVRSGFENMKQNHVQGGNSAPTPQDKFKAKMQANRALSEHFAGGNLNADAQREIRQQYQDSKIQDAMNNGSNLTQQQEMELQKQFDQMFGINSHSPEEDPPAQPSGVAYGSPQALAIRNMEKKMLDEMADAFDGTNTSSGNLANHPKFQQLQAKQKQFESTSTDTGAGGQQNEAAEFKKHVAPVGYAPTLDIVFE